MKTDNVTARKKGYDGEALAAKYLKKQGYRILTCNYTVRGGEIDIVAYDRSFVVFVEVKTRQNDSFGKACEAVTRAKISHLKVAAERFLYEYSDDSAIKNKQPRFDVIEVYTQNNTVNHIKNIEIDF